jgi:hypothetical protein
MDGVAAEVAQEVGMLFEDDAFHPGANEKEAEHHAGRPAADETAPGVHLLARKSVLLHRSIPSGAIMSAYVWMYRPVRSMPAAAIMAAATVSAGMPRDGSP